VFIAQVLVLAAILVWRRAQVGVGLAIWLGVLAVLAGQGYFLDFESMPPRLALAGLLPLVVGLLMLPPHGTRHFLAVTQLALPTPFRAFVTEPSTALLATFPYIWLVGFLVPFAFWLHAGSLVQLARRPRASAPAAWLMRSAGTGLAATGRVRVWGLAVLLVLRR